MLPAVRVNNNRAKQGKFNNNGVRLMQFSSFDGGEDGKHISAGFVEISELFKAGRISIETELFERQ